MSNINRRDFLTTGALGAAALAGGLEVPLAGAAQPTAERVRLAVIGVAGRGAENLRGVRTDANIVALCDVDQNRTGPARKEFPKAVFHEDYRRVIDMKNVEAVLVSTPDHTHACIAAAAMRAGKHVYCEKPLTHSVYECRTLIDLATKHKLVTQMGTQIHADNNYRRVVEIIQANTLGPIRRVQVWHNGRPRAGQLARQETKPPQGLNYDLWLGPAPYRHYHASHLHFDWRWWFDFGGGVLADMACHYMDLPHWALELRRPTSIAAQGRVTYKGDNNMPDIMQVDYHYAARGKMPAVHLTWYHGVPGPDLNGKVTIRGYTSGVLFEGEKGSLVAGYNNYRMLPEDRFKGFQPPKPTIAASVGHHREWLQAIRKGGPTTCNFAYSGALAETVLLGNVAYRAQARLEWDGAAGRLTNKVPQAEQYLRREYRKGWTL
ncbi:MAG TPA: Gfo/Idh/MocA family oxidoreductase [Gemmataceae bacterium]|nr:Gfo/Idh/MocA family oxidoreductase [Gemmataceae bacterium]